MISSGGFDADYQPSTTIIDTSTKKWK